MLGGAVSCLSQKPKHLLSIFHLFQNIRFIINLFNLLSHCVNFAFRLLFLIQSSFWISNLSTGIQHTVSYHCKDFEGKRI